MVDEEKQNFMSHIPQKSLCLRPHHGLCIRYFSGKGYSEEFVENMMSVISSLQEDTNVTLIMTGDDICKACPNGGGTQCNTEDKIKKYDKAVLDILGRYLPEGETLTYGVFQKLIEEHIIKAGEFDRICGDCSWGDLCHNKE